jgi:hypothetical protein
MELAIGGAGGSILHCQYKAKSLRFTLPCAMTLVWANAGNKHAPAIKNLVAFIGPPYNSWLELLHRLKIGEGNGFGRLCDLPFWCRQVCPEIQQGCDGQQYSDSHRHGDANRSLGEPLPPARRLRDDLGAETWGRTGRLPLLQDSV